MHRRPEFSFPGSPARGLLPPRPPGNPNPMAPRYADEEVRWLQASPETNYSHSSGGGSGSGSGSGTPSPQLWASHPAHHHQLHRQYPASAGSSPSRAQAIAEYRREMLDLVRGLPESAYELSLRDIVEHHPSPTSPPRAPPSPPSSTAGHHVSRGVPVPAGAQEKDESAGARKYAVAAATGTVDVEDDGSRQGGSSGKKKQGRKQRTMRKQRSRSMERSVSLDTGLLIKLFLPLSIGGKKKVSPKPNDGKNKKKKKQGKKKEEVAAAQEEEWWTKSEFSEAGSSSRTSSTGSSSNSSAAASVRNAANGGAGANPRAPPTRSWSRKRTGCYAFFRANKGKNRANQD